LFKNTPEQLYKPMKEKSDQIAKRVFTFEFIIQMLRKTKKYSENTEEFFIYLRGCLSEVESVEKRIEKV
jgi:hypothetical protein